MKQLELPFYRQWTNRKAEAATWAARGTQAAEHSTRASGYRREATILYTWKNRETGKKESCCCQHRRYAKWSLMAVSGCACRTSYGSCPSKKAQKGCGVINWWLDNWCTCCLLSVYRRSDASLVSLKLPLHGSSVCMQLPFIKYSAIRKGSSETADNVERMSLLLTSTLLLIILTEKIQRI